MSRFLRYALLSIALAFTFHSLAWACPNCRDALASDPAQAGLVRGFFWSILFLLSMPVLILGGLSSYFYWEVCRAKRSAQSFDAIHAGEGGVSGMSEPTEAVHEELEDAEAVGVG